VSCRPLDHSELAQLANAGALTGPTSNDGWYRLVGVHGFDAVARAVTALHDDTHQAVASSDAANVLERQQRARLLYDRDLPAAQAITPARSRVARFPARTTKPTADQFSTDDLIKRVRAAMNARGLTHRATADQMGMNELALDRLLDPRFASRRHRGPQPLTIAKALAWLNQQEARP
jgi:hypothetical protein